MCGEKQYVRCFCVFFVEDHPRVCGEKIALSELPDEFPGSPPRMRGKARRGGLVLKDDGITPACAGKRAN